MKYYEVEIDTNIGTEDQSRKKIIVLGENLSESTLEDRLAQNPRKESFIESFGKTKIIGFRELSGEEEKEAERQLLAWSLSLWPI